MTPPTPALVATGLACVRGGRAVFDGVGFTLRPGEALEIGGPNGAGKSSLLRMIGGLLTPAAGTIANPFTVAWAGHETALTPGIALGSELRHWARLDGAIPAVVAALDAFGLTPLADLPTGILSSGQRRRAALARVMASGAALWLLDEPGVGLDAASLALLAAAIGAHRAGGGLIVVATHADVGLVAPQRLLLGA